MAMKHLDFVVIGAPKSGTTTLFHFLAGHPELSLPAGKEANFFAHAERRAKGWEAYAGEQFAGASPERRWGTVTPQYLADPDVPARLAEHAPGARLVAVLRNPIDRTYSYYRMLRRDGVERRTFAQAFEEMHHTAPADRERPFSLETRADGYLVRSEYGRCLARWLESFPKEQLQVFFTDELRDRPAEVLKAVLEHLGVDASYRPADLGSEFNRGGDAQRFPWLVPLVRSVSPVRSAWRRLPQPLRQRLFLFWDTEVNVTRGAPERLDPALRAALRDFYAPDVRRLEALLARRAPWAELAAPAVGATETGSSSAA